MKKYETIFENENFSLSKGLLERGPHTGYWLYCNYAKMNLAMSAKTEVEAFAEAIEYYQKRLKSIEQAHKDLTGNVQSFVDGLKNLGIEQEQEPCDFCQSYR